MIKRITEHNFDNLKVDIDLLVYELYGLTEEEIGVVENQ